MKSLSRNRYGTYKLVQKMPGGENMVAFTRILHRTTPDAVMSEVNMILIWYFILLVMLQNLKQCLESSKLPTFFPLNGQPTLSKVES